MARNPPASPRNVDNLRSIPGSEDPPGGGHRHPLRSSCLETPVDRGAGGAIAHGVAESDTTEAALAHVHTIY